jgi:hypothetical protein
LVDPERHPGAVPPLERDDRTEATPGQGQVYLRHFFYGLATIEAILGTQVKSFVAGEPQYWRGRCCLLAFSALRKGKKATPSPFA